MRIQEFDFSINLLRVVLWDYDKAEKLLGLINNKQAAMDRNQLDFWNNWYIDVFNIDTANEFGVSVWAIILDVPLLINVPIVNPEKVGWGFGSFRKNFNNGNFNVKGGGAQLLTIEQRRIAIKMRYQYLTTRATVPEINRILVNAFGDLGVVYVEDNLDMTTNFKFGFTIPAWIDFLFVELGVFPTPASVFAEISEV